MKDHQIERYYLRRRAELQKIETKNSLKKKTVSILDKDARESILVSLSDGRTKEKRNVKDKAEFLKEYGERKRK